MADKPTLFRKMLILLNMLVIIAYLISCLSPFVNTGEDWYLAFPGLIFHLLFMALCFFVILWFILKSRWWWISLLVLVAGFQQIGAAFAFNIPHKFSPDKKPNTLRVLQWNVSGWDNYGRKHNRGHSYQPQMMELVKKEDADVLCIEEFFDFVSPDNFEPVTSTLTAMGFDYHYFVATEWKENDFETGIAIFSKYPITDSSHVGFNENNDGEHLLYADIKVNNTLFRVFATHLQSVHFVGRDYRNLQKIKRAEKPNFGDSRIIVSKLKKGYISRFRQAKMVRQTIDESPYPSFICGDFNDVPNSSTYFTIKGNFQDAFIKKGFFIGGTFRFISPTLRIDYILADKKFRVTQYRRIKVPYSDHYPVEADLAY